METKPEEIAMEFQDQRASPSVWIWYVVYCGLMALLYLIVAAAGLFVLLIDPAQFGEDAVILRIQGVLFLVLGLLFVIPFGAAPFLPKKPWVWIYGLVLIALGMTSVCCLPATIPLLIFWLKPETRRFFGRE
jgi:hypothetical protein